MGLFGKLFGSATPMAAAPAAPAPTSTGTLNLDKPSRLNLIKERSELVQTLCLRKGIDYKSRVAFVVDRSGSMGSRYNSGEVQNVFERLFPIAMQFDDNQAIDFLAFSNGVWDLGEVTLDNFHGCVDEKMKKCPYQGTNYAPFINECIKKFKTPGDPAYVIVIVDGDCQDKQDTKKSMIEASNYGIFFQFVGIGSDNMSFLEELDNMPGRKIDNANFFQIEDLSKETDKGLYGKMMLEYPVYITKAKQLNII